MRSEGGGSGRSATIRGGALVLAASAALWSSLVTGGAGATSPTAAARLTAVPAPGPYLVQAEHASNEIAVRIGHPLSLALSVVVNATDVKIDGKEVSAYVLAQNSGDDPSGAATRCVIHLNPAAYNQKDTTDFNEIIVHEVFHCFEAMDYPSVAAFDAGPRWLLEGAAEWVGETIEPSEDGFWSAYLLTPEIPLFTRAYSAIGFFALMTSSGQDTWRLLDPMLRAGSSGTAYALAVNGQLQADWASSLARQPSFGSGWNATGPGIPDVRYVPTTTIMKSGSSLSASVKAYANALVKFTSVADVVTVTATTPYSRLHEADGKNIDNLLGSTHYCANQCDRCVEMAAMPHLDPGPTWLAETGGASGASFSVAGGGAMCDAACMVGSWKVVNQSLSPNTYGESGGAGTSWVISPQGTLTIDYSGSAPVRTAQGSFTVTGGGVEAVKLPVDPTAASGPWTATIVSEQTFADGQRQGTNIGAVSTGTWTCQGDNMTVTATLGSGLPAAVLTLARDPG